MLNILFKNNKPIYIIGFIVLFFLNLFSFVFGKEFQFLIIGILNFILCIFLLKINPFGKLGEFILFLPLTLLFGITLIYACSLKQYSGVPIFYIYIVSSSFALLIHFFKKKKLLIISYMVIFLVSYLNFENMYNYLFYLKNKSEMVEKKFPKINIYDKNNLSINFEEEYKGKIIVINLWNNSCGYCIKNFPKYEKLKNHYRKDTLVEVISINIQSEKKNIALSEKFLNKFTFSNFYTDNSIYEKLKINGVPYYVILDENFKIKYIGSLNTEKLETYNNIYDLIENEK